MRPEDSLKATPDMQFWLEGLQFESQFRQTNRFFQKPLGQEDPHISSLNVATRQNSSSSPGYCSEETFAFLVNNIGAYFSVEWGTARLGFPQSNSQAERALLFISLFTAHLTHQPRDVLLNAYHTNNTAVLARGSILWACCETLVWSDIIWNLFNKVCDTFVSDDGTERL